MRKTTHILSIALLTTIIGLSGFVPSHKANADKDECSVAMAEETSRYIREMKIPLKSADFEFYGNKAEQVYLLNSEETLKLDSRKTIRNTVAVIDHKDASARSSFYVIEQEITPGKVTFFLKKDFKVLQTLPMTLFVGSTRRPQAIPGNCDCSSLDAYRQARSAELMADANRTCKAQSDCLPHCSCFNGNQSVAWAITIFEPTSWRCRKLSASFQTATLWAGVRGGRLLAHAFDIAIKKEAALYTF